MGNAPLECVFPQRHAHSTSNGALEAAAQSKEEPTDPVALLTLGITVLQYDTSGSCTQINLFYSTPPRGLGRLFWCRLGQRKKIREQSLRVRKITVVDTVSQDIAAFVSSEKYVGLLSGEGILHLEADARQKEALKQGLQILQTRAPPKRRRKTGSLRAFPLSSSRRNLRNNSPGFYFSGSQASDEDEGDESFVSSRRTRGGRGLGDNFDDGFGTWWDDAESGTGDLDFHQFGQAFGDSGEDEDDGFGSNFGGDGPSGFGRFGRSRRGFGDSRDGFGESNNSDGFDEEIGGSGQGRERRSRRNGEDSFEGEEDCGDRGVRKSVDGSGLKTRDPGIDSTEKNQETKNEAKSMTASSRSDLLASIEARKQTAESGESVGTSADAPPAPIFEGDEGAPPPPPFEFDENGVPMAPPPPFLALAPVAKSKTRQFHWETTHVVQGSIWEEFAEEQESPHEALHNPECLEELFSNKAPPPKKKSGASDEVVRVIDKKRADNVEICLRRLKFDPDKVLTLLVAVDSSLDGDTIELLARCAPDHEELKKVKHFSDKSQVGFTEQLFMTLSEVPDSKARFQALEFTRRFQTGLDALYASLGILDQAASVIKKSTSLKTVLGVVLKVGNLMNQGTRKGNAGAFTLKSLLMLNNTKAHDGQSSLLDFVVQEVNRFMAKPKKKARRRRSSCSSSDGDKKVQESSPDPSSSGLLLPSKVTEPFQAATEQEPLAMHVAVPTSPETLEDEPPPLFKSVFVGFEILAEANHVQWEPLDKEIIRLTRGVEGLKAHVAELQYDLSIPGSERFCEVINEFIQKADPSTHELKQRRAAVVKFFHRLHVYFGEEPPPPDSVKLEILGLLHSFVVTYQSAEMKAHDGAMRQWRLAKKANQTPGKSKLDELVDPVTPSLSRADAGLHSPIIQGDSESTGIKVQLRSAKIAPCKVNESPLDDAFRAGKSRLRTPSSKKDVDDATLQASLLKFSLRKAKSPVQAHSVVDMPLEHAPSQVQVELEPSSEGYDTTLSVTMNSSLERSPFGSSPIASSAESSSLPSSFSPTSSQFLTCPNPSSSFTAPPSAKDALRQLSESLQQLSDFSVADLLNPAPSMQIVLEEEPGA